MSQLMNSVDQRTKMVGQNRLEMLLFTLDGGQTYGINVFNVREVLQCPVLTELPQRHRVIRGVAHIRGATISIIDLSCALGGEPIESLENSFVIITEYNRAVQGFLVHSVLRIVLKNWNEIHPPPVGSGQGNYLTSVTEADNAIVEIIDVEKVLAEITPAMTRELNEEWVAENAGIEDLASVKVLLVDDSTVARKQIARYMERLGVTCVQLENGQLAWEHLESLVKQGVDITSEYAVVISDIEMPELDGYTLVSRIRENAKMKDLYVVLHSSLSGSFNEAMVKKVGADKFYAKFTPESLAAEVKEIMYKIRGIVMTKV
ncbi:MAG: chemotaxis protein [Gammaproteobacteria bacterium]